MNLPPGITTISGQPEQSRKLLGCVEALADAAGAQAKALHPATALITRLLVNMRYLRPDTVQYHCLAGVTILGA
ncbi:hypothetical protein ACMC5O_001529 [Sphingomonas sediminicola]|uniref:hypothetical protein n=1 Tax=Sphingomonas sediminicola TaxID=386874 RepID=UPI003CF96CC4